MDYKRMYDAIPYGFKDKVWQTAGVSKSTVSRWLNATKGRPADIAVKRIEDACFKLLAEHIVKNMRIAFGNEKIIVGHPLGDNKFEYGQLLGYKFELEMTPNTSSEAMVDMLGVAKNIIMGLWNEYEDATRLLIAKCVIAHQKETA